MSMLFDYFQVQETVDVLAAPDLVCSRIRNVFAYVTTSDAVELLSRTLAFPMRELMKAVFSNCAYSTKIRATFVQPSNLAEKVYLLWKSICTCFRNHYSKSFSSELLAVLAPMLVSGLIDCGLLIHVHVNF